jgi:O-antigen/teichoic acid export membrane protein
LTLLGFVVVARIVQKAEFGELGMVQASVGMFGTFAGLGLGLTATKHVAELRQSDPSRVGRIIGMLLMVSLVAGLTMTLLMYLASPALAAKTLAAPHIAGLLRTGSLLVILGTLNGTLTGILTGLEAFRTVAVVNSWSGLLSCPILVAGVFFGGLPGAVWGLVGSQVVNLLLNQHAVRFACLDACILVQMHNWLREAIILVHFSLPAFLSNLLGGPIQWACSAILVNQPNGYEEMALINASNQWRSALMFLPGLLNTSLLPLLASEVKAAATFTQSLDVSHKGLTILVPLSILPLMTAAGLILSAYGAGFIAGRSALLLALAGTAVSTVSSPAGTAMIATGRMWLSLLLQAVFGITYVCMTLLFVGHFGASGLMGGFLVAHVLLSILGFYCLRDIVPIQMVRRNLVCLSIIITATLFSLGFPVL